MRLKRSWIAIAAVCGLLACGGGADGDESPGGSSAEVAEAPAAETAPTGAQGFDPALAADGEALLQAKGCTACHRVGGGRLVGPDLAGVTQRRSPEFIVAMIVNPDSMLANDATAKQLLGEYYTPMQNQSVTRQDAEALLEFFKRNDVGGQ
jgi:mono/diheme cytochrome c family protein